MSNKVYEMVTQNIIDQLNEGIIPWEKPWTGALNGAFNRVTKKSYSFLNQCLLRKPGEYATFKQWQELGGKIKKGSKGSMVIFWKMYVKETGEVDENGEKKTETIPVLRYYNVFHIDDVEGVEPLPAEERTAPDPIQAGEDILNYYWTREGIDVDICISNEAFFRPSCDYIKLPQRDQYNDISEFYSTAFHESVHSTGIPSRLDRGLGVKLAAFGSSDYSKEELVAELGAAMLMNVSGIENTHTSRNSAAYIQGWLKALENDVNLIISASAKAQKAVDFILDGYEPTGTDDDDTTEATEDTSEAISNTNEGQALSADVPVASQKIKKNVLHRDVKTLHVSFNQISSEYAGRNKEVIAFKMSDGWHGIDWNGKMWRMFSDHLRNAELCSIEELPDRELVTAGTNGANDIVLIHYSDGSYSYGSSAYVFDNTFPECLHKSNAQEMDQLLDEEITFYHSCERDDDSARYVDLLQRMKRALFEYDAAHEELLQVPFC